MLLCIDVGNTNTFCGILDQQGTVIETFRYDTKTFGTSDQFGLFISQFFEQKKIDVNAIKRIMVSSVVPSVNHSLMAACIKYIDINPDFLRSETNGFLEIRCLEPSYVGADLIAGAIAASQLHPDKNIIVIGFGTATTISVISKTKEYLGTIILPGIKTAMDSLASSTSLLYRVAIKKPTTLVGRSTAESIQSGLFYGQVGTIKECINHIIPDYFKGEIPVIIGTGGFVNLFENEKFFTITEPCLVLKGLYFKALKNNHLSLA